jgi:glycosyltransferase involved in cell wall biosynthesis
MNATRDAQAASTAGLAVGRISVIAPMLDERAHIDSFVADIAAQDFAGDVELIVADGGSRDGSPQLLRAAAARHGLEVTVLENPESWVSQGLNRCVGRATGDLLVRLDCHSRYPPDYFRRCAEAAEETDALVVGGVIVAQGRTSMERAVAAAMDSAFGGIGFYRVASDGAGPLGRLRAALGIAPPGAGDGGTERVDSDTITFGAFRPAAFARAGLFDESLRRNQDDEFTLRVRKVGGRVLLDRSIHVHYVPRGSLRGVYRQYFQYGRWKVPVVLKHRTPPSLRSLVPPAFVGSVAILAPAAVASRAARLLLAGELAAYGALAAGSGLGAVRRRRDPVALLPRVVAVFPAFHVGYGAGMLAGWLSAAVIRVRG